MSNDISALAPILFSAARIVPKELTGFAAAATTDFDDKGVAKGDTVKVPVVPALTKASVTPGATFATGTDKTDGSANLTLNQFEEVSWHYTAEEERSLFNGGNQAETFRQTVEQGIRTLRNAIEARAAVIADQNASRAIGTAATTPYASNLNDASKLKKELDRNGAPQDGRSVIYNLDAAQNIRDRLTVGYLAGAEARGEVASGAIIPLHGMMVRESAQVASHTAGTASGYLINNTPAYAVGTTTITVDAGSGTILAGDVVEFGTGDGTFYGVKTALSGSTFAIQAPGLLATEANNVNVLVKAAHVANIAMHRSGLVIVARPGLQPEGPVAQQMVVTDSETGFSFLMLRVVQNAQTSYFMRVVYDAFAPNPEYIIKHMG